jgi:hypothetical protein
MQKSLSAFRNNNAYYETFSFKKSLMNIPELWRYATSA